MFTIGAGIVNMGQKGIEWQNLTQHAPAAATSCPTCSPAGPVARTTAESVLTWRYTATFLDASAPSRFGCDSATRPAGPGAPATVAAAETGDGTREIGGLTFDYNSIILFIVTR